jgi:hypothetical protein
LRPGKLDGRKELTGGEYSRRNNREWSKLQEKHLKEERNKASLRRLRFPLQLHEQNKAELRKLRLPSQLHTLRPSNHMRICPHTFAPIPGPTRKRLGPWNRRTQEQKTRKTRRARTQRN